MIALTLQHYSHDALITIAVFFFLQGTGNDYVFEFGTSGRGYYYLATRVNPNNRNYLDIVLEGVADGWVAVGFSRNLIMVA